MKRPTLEHLFPTPLLKVEVARHKEYKQKFVPLLMKLMKDNPGNQIQWGGIDNCWSASHDLVGNE